MAIFFANCSSLSPSGAMPASPHDFGFVFDIKQRVYAMSNAQAYASPARPLLHALARNWWLILLRGCCAILFGILAFAWPGLTLFTLILLYGAFVLADGILAIAAAITGGVAAPRWWLAVIGVLGIAAGAITFSWPGLTAIILLIFIATWAIATGIMQIIGAIRLRKEIDNEWLLIAGGLLSVLFGVVLFMQPGAGALALVLVIGAYAIIYGILLVSFSLRLRKHSHTADRHPV